MKIQNPKSSKNFNSRIFRVLAKMTLLMLISLFILSCNSGPKTQDVNLTYLIKDNKLFYDRIPGSTLFNENPKLKVSTTVTNTSDYGGVFKFYAKLTSQGNVIEFSEEQFIESGKTVTFSQTKEINHYSFQANVEVENWGIIAPIKTIFIK